MGNYIIPERGIKASELLDDLSEEKFNLLLEYYKSLPIGFSLKSLNNTDSSKLEIDKKDFMNLSELIFNLNHLMDDRDSTVFLNEIYESIKDSALNKDIKFSNNFKNRILQILNLENLTVTQKALRLINNTPKKINNVKIYTDMRPMLDKKTEDFNNYVLIHNLKIEFYEDFEEKEIFFTLEKDILTKFLEVLSRAEKKEKIIIEKFNNIELKNISIE